MKYTLNKNEFIEWMQKSPYNPFSYEALEILWDYFESLDENNLKETEFDPVDFRCRFSENVVDDVLEFFDIDGNGLSDADKKSLALAYLKKETTVLGITDIGTVVYKTF
jgi:hypothetical protein